jgi:phosphate transport system substrate-binding protein
MKANTALQIPARVVLLMGFAGMALAALAETQTDSGPLRSDGRRVTVDPNIPAYDAAPPLTGDLHIVGGLSRPPGSATAAGPATTDTLVELWVEIFKRAHPSVRVHTSLYASANAAGALAEQSAQLGVTARELLPHELFPFQHAAFKLIAVPVAGGAYNTREVISSQVVIVNKDNPLQRLTLAQLDAIFSKTRKRGYKEDITRWGQLGLTGAWSDEPIHLHSNYQPNGIPYFFALRALDGGEFKDTLSEQEDQDAVILRVEEDRYAIAFVNRNYARSGTRIVALGETESGPFSVGSFEEVLNQTYPLSRVIYLYVNRYPGKPIDPLAKEFIRAALSQEGQQAVARTLYLPFPLAKVRESLGKLE